MTITNKLVLPANAVGRDLIIGDLHGCFDELMELLAHVDFNTLTDRLFSVGDLIDRGPKSKECIDLLTKPWFYATLGNHEQLLLKYVQRPYGDDAVIWWQNGANWAIDLRSYGGPQPVSHEQLRQFALMIEIKMPLVIVVGEGEQRFNILHAQLNKLKPYTGKICTSLEEMMLSASEDDTVGSDEDIDSEQFNTYNILWSRNLVVQSQAGIDHTMRTAILDNPQPLSKTFVGHTPVRNVTCYKSHYFIDTGCVYTLGPGTSKEQFYGGLTIVNAHTNEYVTYKPGLNQFTDWTPLPLPSNPVNISLRKAPLEETNTTSTTNLVLGNENDQSPIAGRNKS